MPLGILTSHEWISKIFQDKFLSQKIMRVRGTEDSDYGKYILKNSDKKVIN